MESQNFRVLLVYPNEPQVGVVPSSIALLSACLKRANLHTKLFDTTIYRPVEETQDEIRTKIGQVKKTAIDKYVKYRYEDVQESFLKTVEEYQPNLIAATLVDSTISYALSFLEKIKHLNIPVVVGGIAATFQHEKLLKNDLINFVCVGEGEEALVELSEHLRDHQDYSKIKNICFKDQEGNIIKNPLRPLIDLNTLPCPDFSIYENFRFYRPFRGRVVRMLQIDIDRGCPFSCTYCAAPSLRELYQKENIGNYYRTKSFDKVLDEIKQLVADYSINFIWISSETFFARRQEEVAAFAKRYKDEVGLPFWCQTRLDTFTEEKTKLLYDMGCQAVSVGLEHGSEEIRRNLLNKHISNEKIIEAVKILSKFNIFPSVNSMIGLPGETREDVFKTIEMNRKISSILSGDHSISTFIFMPFSGTPLRKICLEKGYVSEDSEMPFSFFKHSTLTMPSLSKEEIHGLEKTLPFYVRLPESYFPQIKIAEKGDEEGKRMFEHLSKIYQETIRRND